MNQLAILWYRDWHRLVNAIAAVRRSPARILIWGFVALWLVFQVWQRAALSRNAVLFPDLKDPFASAIAGLILALTGLTLGSATGNSRLTALGDPVDAYFLVRSSLDQRVVLFWLQLRQIFLSLFGVALASIVLAIYFSHGHATGATLGLAGVLILMQALMPPTALIARRTNMLRIVWYTIAAVGVVVLLTSFIFPDVMLSLGIGRALIALWRGDGIALAVLYGCVALAFLAGIFYADDIYPELYATTRLLAGAHARVHRGDLFAPRLSNKATRSGTTSLRGPWVEIWKQLAFLRRGNGGLASIIAAALAVALGTASGIAERRSLDVGIAIGFTALVLVLVLETTRSVSLSQDIAKPLWWMGDGSTFAKLAVWTFASALPAIAFVMLGATVMLAICAPAAIPIFVPLAGALVVVTRALGMLGYALAPALVDQRGPGMIIRLLLFYAGTFAALIPGVLAGVVTHSVAVGIAVAAIIALSEGAVCIALASRRLGGRGMEIALAESM